MNILGVSILIISLLIILFLVINFIKEVLSIKRTHRNFKKISKEIYEKWKTFNRHEIYRRLCKNYPFVIHVNSLRYRVKFVSYDGEYLKVKYENSILEIPKKDITFSYFKELDDFFRECKKKEIFEYKKSSGVIGNIDHFE